MDYAVVLYFDNDSEKLLTEYIHNICSTGINTYMIDIGIRPHITLAIFKDIHTGNFEGKLHDFALNNRNFRLRLESIGIFPAEPGVVFLSPVFTDDLKLIHTRFYDSFKDALGDYMPYYLPGSWVPHCTVASRLQHDEIMKALSFLINEFKPMDVDVAEIGFIECDPVKELCCYETNRHCLGNL